MKTKPEHVQDTQEHQQMTEKFERILTRKKLGHSLTAPEIYTTGIIDRLITEAEIAMLQKGVPVPPTSPSRILH